MGKKIARFDKYVIRQQIGDGEISLVKDTALPGVASGASGTATITFTKLEEGQDLRPLLVLGSNYESFIVGDYHYLPSAVAAPSYDATTNTRAQVVTISHYRLTTASSYTSGTLQVTHTNLTANRRRWSSKTQTLMVDFPIDTTIEYSFPYTTNVPATDLRYNGTALTVYSEARVHNIEISLIGHKMSGHRLLVLYGDKNNKYIKLETYREQMYQDIDTNPANILDYFVGNFVAERTVFSGSIESIEDYIEDGQFKFHISGRNDISKLLGPIVNKNYAYSHDYIYSTLGPFGQTTAISGTVTSVSAEAGDRTFNLTSASGISIGDYLFDAYERFIGIIENIVESYGTFIITLEEGSLIAVDNGNAISKFSGDYITLGKAMSTNNNATNKTTSLIGATGKGLIFTSGKSLNSTTGADSTSLVDTSSNSDSRARGYYINDTRAIGEEEEFMCKLSDESGPSTTYSTTHTPNSISQFSVIDIDAKEGETIISLAPNCPAILGRIDENFDDVNYITLTKTAFQVKSAVAINSLGAIDLKGSDPIALLNNPVYTSTSFLGNVIAIRWKNGTLTPSTSGFDVSSGAFNFAEMLLDRPLPVALAEDDYLYTSDQKTHGFYGVNSQGMPNGGTLHLLNSSLSHTGNVISFSYGDKSGRAGDYGNQYGQFLFRYMDLQKGPSGILSYNRRKSESGVFEDGIYQRNLGKTSVYASSYRSSSGILNETYAKDYVKSDAREQQGSPETRGQTPTSGSNFEDFTIYGDSAETPEYNTIAQYNSSGDGFHWLPTTAGATNALIGHRENAVKQMRDKLEQIDPKMQRLFLFSLGDLYPESMNRWNHLGFTNRDLTNYSLVLKSKPVNAISSTNHTKYAGNAFSEEVLDESYETLSISNASITANEMRRFGLLRLTELTMDWHFNPINSEYPLDEIGIEPFDAIHYLKLVQPSTFSGISHNPQILLAANYSVNYTTIALGTNGNTVGGAGGFKIFGTDAEVNPIPPVLPTAHASHVYAEDGSWLGSIASSTVSSIVLNLPANAINGLHYANDQTGQTGYLYIMKKAGAVTYKNFEIRGRGNQNSWMQVDAANPKNVVMGNSLTTGDNIWPSREARPQHLVVHVPYGYESSASTIGDYFDFTAIDSSGSLVKYRVWQNLASSVGGAPAAGGRTLVEVDIAAVDYNDILAIADTYAVAMTALRVSGNPIVEGASNSAHRYFFIRNIYEGQCPPPTNSSPNASTLTILTDWRFTILAEGKSSNAVQWDSNFGFSITNGFNDVNEGHVDLGVIIAQIREASFTSGLLQSTTNVFLNTAQGQDSTTASVVFNSLRDNSLTGTQKTYRGMKMVSLQELNLENFSKEKFSKGAAVDLGGTIEVTSGSIGKVNSYIQVKTQTDAEGASAATDRFFANKDSSGSINARPQGKSIGSGAHVVFKPILTNSSDVAFSTGSLFGHKPNGSSAALGKITVTLDGSSNEWLRYAPNLTGCYLASTEATRYGTSTLNSAYTGDYEGAWSVGTATDVDKAVTASMEDKIPKALHYIVSHEVVTTTGISSIQHILIIDNYSASYQSLAYRILQPNETCIWENTPSQIDLYKMSSKYTRGVDGKMYGESPNFERYEEEAPIVGVESFYGYNEAVQSMYVVVDMEPKEVTVPPAATDAHHVVPRSTGKVFGSGKKFEDGTYAMYLNDGETSHQRNMQVTTGTNRSTITLNGENKQMSGIVSFGEIFTVTSLMPTTITDATVANIATTITICDEAEDIIKDTLENQNIDYEISTIEFPIFTGPDIKGADLGSVIDNLASMKSKELYIDSKGIKIRDDNTNFTFTNVELNEKKNDIQIIDVTRNDSVYDFYNEIIVYGLYVKCIKKDRKSINKIGNKTLEHFDEKILTQSEVDKKAEELLLLHSNPEDRITVRVSAIGTEFVNQGDIITMSFPSEKINKGPYVILEVRRKMQGITEFEIGRYNKNLTDRLAELIVQNKSVAAFLRGNRFKTAVEDIGFVDTTRVKELKLVVRHRTVTGSPATIGFGTAINAATKAIGFDLASGSVNTTTILEEDL
jgi:hypothetical protein